MATLGLWEVVGLPAEIMIDGTDVQVEVHYDRQQTVDHIVVLKEDKAINPPRLFRRKHRPGRPRRSTCRWRRTPRLPLARSLKLRRPSDSVVDDR